MTTRVQIVAADGRNEVGGAQTGNDRLVDGRGCRQVEKAIAADVPLFFQLDDAVAQTHKAFGVVILAGDVEETGGKSIPLRTLEFDFRICHHAGAGSKAQLIIAQWRTGVSKNDKVGGQEPLLREFVYRGQQFSVCQVARRAKNDH